MIKVNWKNPITRGLGFAIPFSAKRFSRGITAFEEIDGSEIGNNSVLPVMPNETFKGKFQKLQGDSQANLSSSRINGEHGLRLTGAPNEYLNVIFTSLFDVSGGGDWTLFIRAAFHDRFADNAIFGIGATIFQLWADTDGNQLRLGTYDGQAFYGSETLIPNILYSICYSYSDTTKLLTAYLNGVVSIEHTDFQNIEKQTLRIGECGGKESDMTVVAAMGWGRTLNYTEVRSVSSNPWQLFEQPRIPLTFRRKKHVLVNVGDNVQDEQP